MPYVRLQGGVVAHVKVAKRRPRRCSVSTPAGRCTADATIQCDYPVDQGRTCDAHVCRAHAVSVGPDLDHCAAHAGHQAGLFTGLLP